MKKLKISSIFHWLYCALLLAPCFAVGSATLQYAFTGSQIQAVEPVIAPVVSDGTKEPFKLNEWVVLHNVSDDGSTISMNGAIDIFWYFSELDSFYLISLDLPSHFEFYASDNGHIEYNFYVESSMGASGDVIFSFVVPRYEEVFVGWRLRSGAYEPILEPELYYQANNVPQSLIDKLPRDYVGGNSDVFYSAVDKVSKSPFFNWADKTFLGEGFRYAGNWFGLPENSPFYTFVTYWCAVSILWLIFDVLMYVPLLVHRWLDKGAIE